MEHEAAPPWVAGVTADDVANFELSLDTDCGTSIPEAVAAFAVDIGADVWSVQSCLELVRSHPCILLGGSPLGVLAFSARTGLFRAAFDGVTDTQASFMNASQAGIWLTLFAAEAGPLPAAVDHWLLARLGNREVTGANGYALDLVQRHAELVLSGTDPFTVTSPSSFERQMGQAIWRCIAHRLR